jgi:rhodanese-related sulfurtransferase
VDVGRFEHRDVADAGAPQAGRDGDARGSTSTSKWTSTPCNTRGTAMYSPSATSPICPPPRPAPPSAILTVIDVRTHGEYASGHIAGAHNIPLDHLDAAVTVLKSAAERGDLVMVCASGARSAQACATRIAHNVPAATLTGGIIAWSRHGHDLHRPADARGVWPMGRQVRFVAGSLILAGLAVGQRRAAARWLSVGVAGGLVCSAVSGSCAMARVLAELPLNQPRSVDLDATLAALATMGQ